MTDAVPPAPDSAARTPTPGGTSPPATEASSGAGVLGTEAPAVAPEQGLAPAVRGERDGPVTTVILSRPAARNAVDGPTAQRLAAAHPLLHRGRAGGTCTPHAGPTRPGLPTRDQEAEPLARAEDPPKTRHRPTRPLGAQTDLEDEEQPPGRETGAQGGASHAAAVLSSVGPGDQTASAPQSDRGVCGSGSALRQRCSSSARGRGNAGRDLGRPSAGAWRFSKGLGHAPENVQRDPRSALGARNGPGVGPDDDHRGRPQLVEPIPDRIREGVPHHAGAERVQGKRPPRRPEERLLVGPPGGGEREHGYALAGGLVENPGNVRAGNLVEASVDHPVQRPYRCVLPVRVAPAGQWVISLCPGAQRLAR